MKRILLTGALLLGALCTGRLPADPHRDDHSRWPVGGLYTMDNAAGGNQVWAFGRTADGSLTGPTAYATGGLGSGDALGNQGAVILSRDGRWLFVCNAGSDDVSVFSVTPDGLVLSDRSSSQGRRPISLTLHRNLLYVLNAGGATPGGSDSIAGFLFTCGRLIPLPESMRGLSADRTDPAQIGFTREGDHLVVTEKATALIEVFDLDDCGSVLGVQLFASPNPPPFGFAVGRAGRVLVTEANGGAGNPGASTVSSYEVKEDGSLQTLSASVATHQTAACWVALSPDGRLAFTANTPSDSISSLGVRRDGTLVLLRSQAAMTGAGSGPVDMAFSRDGRYLYSLNAGNSSIGAFRVNPRTGALQPLSGAAGLPRGVNGLAGQ